MFKKVLCLTMGLALLLTYVTVRADGDTYSYTDESGVVYEYSVSDNEATITQISNASGDVTIPSKIEQYSINYPNIL